MGDLDTNVTIEQIRTELNVERDADNNNTWHMILTYEIKTMGRLSTVRLARCMDDSGWCLGVEERSMTIHAINDLWSEDFEEETEDYLNMMQLAKDENFNISKKDAFYIFSAINSLQASHPREFIPEFKG